MKTINPGCQATVQTTSNTKTQKTVPRHIITELLKTVIKQPGPHIQVCLHCYIPRNKDQNFHDFLFKNNIRFKVLSKEESVSLLLKSQQIKN